MGKVAARPTAIPEIEELKLANGLKTTEIWGWSLSRKESFEVISHYVKSNIIKTPFKTGVLGEDTGFWGSKYDTGYLSKSRKTQSSPEKKPPIPSSFFNTLISWKRYWTILN